MDSIEQLITILTTQRSGDSIARISLSPWAWLLLKTTASECWLLYSGFDRDEFDPRAAGDSLTISVDHSQRAAFRLWDREGQEVISEPPAVSSPTLIYRKAERAFPYPHLRFSTASPIDRSPILPSPDPEQKNGQWPDGGNTEPPPPHDRDSH